MSQNHSREDPSQFSSILTTFERETFERVRNQEQRSVQGNPESEKTALPTNKQPQEKFEDISFYYNQVFSPSETVNAIQRRNEALQILQFDQKKSNSEEEQIYKRRANRVKSLKQKDTSQLDSLYDIEFENPGKFQSLLKILKYLASVKGSSKLDYFSRKTFLALKGSSEKELQRLFAVLQGIYKESKQNFFEGHEYFQHQQNIDSFNKQFSLILRFLISRDKIQELIRQEEIRDNFTFLIQNMCMTAENNEANKKTPDSYLVELLKQLLIKPKGREIFRSICSINHGNRYRLKFGMIQYEKLFKLDFEELKEVEITIKLADRKATKQIRNKNPSQKPKFRKTIKPRVEAKCESNQEAMSYKNERNLQIRIRDEIQETQKLTNFPVWVQFPSIWQQRQINYVFGKEKNEQIGNLGEFKGITKPF